MTTQRDPRSRTHSTHLRMVTSRAWSSTPLFVDIWSHFLGLWSIGKTRHFILDSYVTPSLRLLCILWHFSMWCRKDFVARSLVHPHTRMSLRIFSTSSSSLTCLSPMLSTSTNPAWPFILDRHQLRNNVACSWQYLEAWWRRSYARPDSAAPMENCTNSEDLARHWLGP